MGNQSPELIEQQMEETRESLTEKVALLEQQVVGTLQSATDAVQGTVDSVRTAVADTAATVSDAVKSSVECVKGALDVERQTREHPWAMMGCSMAAGLVTGLMVFRRGTVSSSTSTGAVPAPAFTPQAQHVVHHRPRWLDELLELAGGEVKKVAEQALMTASTALKQTISTRLPQMVDKAVATCQNGRSGAARDEEYPQPAI